MTALTTTSTTLLFSIRGIRDRYEAWTDPLSQRLKKCIAKTNPSNLDRRIDVLTTKILVNPFNERIPLQSPVLDREWVWEESFLNHYQQQTGLTISPFDGQPINAKPHAFAREILALMRSTTSIISITSTAPVQSEASSAEGENEVVTACSGSEDLVTLASVETSAQRVQRIFTLYWVFAQRFIQRELCRRLTSSIGQSIDTLTLHTAVSEAETERLKEKNAVALAGLSDSCAESSSSIRTTEKTTIQVHQTIVEDRQSRLSSTEETINVMKRTLEAQKLQIESLRREREQLR